MKCITEDKFKKIVPQHKKILHLIHLFTHWFYLLFQFIQTKLGCAPHKGSSFFSICANCRNGQV